MNAAEPAKADFNRREFLKGGSTAAVLAMMGGVELIAEPAAPPTAETKLAAKKIKVGLIGLGAQGRDILDQLGRLEQADVAAICDHYAPMLRRSAAKSPGAAAVEDYKAILANPEIPAVIIATGSHQHKAIALEAIAAGKHVYCEAPLAHTVEDAKAIARAAKAAPGKVFQPGLQMRSDRQRHFLLPFIRSGALGKPAKARAQWYKKQSWRTPSPNPEREREANWRLQRDTSPGLVGEIGIHALDQAGWFLDRQPVAVTGHGSTMLWTDDGREVPDTAEVVIEYSGGVRLHYQASLATSFDAEYELLQGSDATVMMRDGKAWMFKEVDSPVLGWEVYARKEVFYKESGIALVAGGSKQLAAGSTASEETATALPPLYQALEAFLGNCIETDEAVADFKSFFPDAGPAALQEHLSTIEFRKAATYAEGHAATVLALKANEAVLRNARLELKPELFELA